MEHTIAVSARAPCLRWRGQRSLSSARHPSSINRRTGYVPPTPSLALRCRPRRLLHHRGGMMAEMRKCVWRRHTTSLASGAEYTSGGRRLLLRPPPRSIRTTKSFSELSIYPMRAGCASGGSRGAGSGGGAATFVNASSQRTTSCPGRIFGRRETSTSCRIGRRILRGHLSSMARPCRLSQATPRGLRVQWGGVPSQRRPFWRQTGTLYLSDGRRRMHRRIFSPRLI